jgi:hypothetical protein
MVGNSGGDYLLEEFERAKKQKMKEAIGQSDYRKGRGLRESGFKGIARKS